MRVPEVCPWGICQIFVPEHGALQNGALRYHGNAVHVGSLPLGQAMPVDGGGTPWHHVDHIYHDRVALAYLRGSVNNWYVDILFRL